MTSVELIIRVEGLLSELAKLDLWNTLDRWSEGFAQFRSDLFHILFSNNPGSNEHNSAKKATEKMKAQFKEPILKHVHFEIAEVEKLLTEFFRWREEPLSTSDPLFSAGQDVLESFLRTYDAFMKYQNPHDVAHFWDASERLKSWHDNFILHLMLIRDRLAASHVFAINNEDLVIFFDGHLTVSEMAMLLSRLSNVYSLLCEFIGQSGALEAVKIESGSLTVWLKGHYQELIRMIVDILARVLPQFTTRNQIVTSDAKIKLAENLVNLASTVNKNVVDQEAYRARTNELVDALYDEVIEIARTRPRFLVDGKIIAPYSGDVQSPQLSVAPPPKRLE